MTAFPVPDAAFDDRLGFVGTSGGGKTYAASATVERLLATGSRIIIVDPLGVWFGLRLRPDGKAPSPFNVVIFGGPHGDLPLNEHAGTLIGETVAGMSESCIIDLSQLGTKASERRFMLALLTAIYRNVAGTQLHIVFDEADMFAPQQIRDKDGDAAKLLGQMETIVRRGRAKGFVPWLITQRPAVLNKDVLSQVDGLIAFKLTSTQDRDQLGDWVDGQADRDQWKGIRADLATLARGTAVIWLPARGILSTETFPLKKTFDSSRSPARGEVRITAQLKPLDIAALEKRLSAVKAEVDENDPKKLKARIASLQAELQRGAKGASPEQLASARDEGYQRGLHAGRLEGAETIRELKAAIQAAAGYLAPFIEAPDGGVPVLKIRRVAPPTIEARPIARPAPQIASKPRQDKGSTLTPARQRILDAIAWAASMGTRNVPREIVAFLADASPRSSAFTNNLGALRTARLIDYPGGGGLVALTADGEALAVTPRAALTHEAMMAKIGEKLVPAQMRILRAAADHYPEAIGREMLAEAADASPTSSAFTNNLGRLHTLGLITYPVRGTVRADDRIFP